MDSIDILGLLAGGITSFGFIPQLIRGYKIKKLDDVSYFMPIVLAIGMFLWFLYGIFLKGFPIIIANAFGILCCIMLIIMKKIYTKK